MCGICGILHFDKSRSVDRNIVEAMTATMTHRGPDDEGFYVSRNIALGFRRLSIIDIQGGHQPMSNETEDVWIAYNGEFYNHKDVRKRLIANGHRYRTNADTESIVHLYEEKGIDCFSQMIGMFGVAIWDDRNARLVLCRDRLGIKPLYYATFDNSLIFASEIKSILRYPGIEKTVDMSQLHEQLIFRYIAGEGTLFAGIKKILPGHLIVAGDDGWKIIKYWDVDPSTEKSSINEESASDQLIDLLRESVQLRLMSDVPLGTFCSGGVDSGLTTAYAKESATGELNTFSIGFHEEDWDETRYAKLVADKYGSRHHVIRIDNGMYADAMPKLIWHHDEPLYHPSSGLVYYVSKLAREFVTVVLTGEGADELFGGYPRFLIPREYSRLSGLPRFVRRLTGGALSVLPSHKTGKLGYFLPKSMQDVAVYNSQYVRPELVNRLLTFDPDDTSLEYRRSLVQEAKLDQENLTEFTMYLDLKTYVAAALHRQDKMSMAVSLESRVPFLDHRLVEWAIRLPLDLKIRGMKNKYILKKLGEKMIPREAIYRQKVGFGVPVVDWLRDKHGLGRYLELFEEKRYEERGYVDATAVRRLVGEHLSGSHDHCEILWNLLNLEIWHRVLIENRSADDIC